MSHRPSTLGTWLRRKSLPLIAVLGGASGLVYAAARHDQPKPAAPASVPAAISPTPPVAVTTTPPAKPTPEPTRDLVQDTIQVAILLDTSSSMDGLINQARSHLWKMVDDLGQMTRVVDGKVRGVKIELALYEYGNQGLAAQDGFLRQVLPLTSDLDKVSEALHRLSTNGGDEHVGQVIKAASTGLQWSADPNALKYVFVAGNEEFDQGPVSAKAAMAAARARGINVQLIHCGGQDPTWAAAAKLAHSDLMTLDQNHVAQHIPAPQDDEILRLGAELNTTYMAYGAQGQESYARQSAADASSAKMSPKVAIERAQLKRKKSYSNATWDLVDAVERDADFLTKAKDDQLPTELRGKSLEEKQRLVAEKTATREAIKAKIAKLEAERATFLAAEQAKQSKTEAPSLDAQMVKAAKSAAAKKGYKF